MKNRRRGAGAGGWRERISGLLGGGGGQEELANGPWPGWAWTAAAFRRAPLYSRGRRRRTTKTDCGDGAGRAGPIEAGRTPAPASQQGQSD
jgi:hypothetical protein